VAIAALFDLDGTLIARNSASLYMRHLRRTGQARRRDVAQTLYFLARYKLGLLDVERALAVSMTWVVGRREDSIRDDCADWYAREVRPFVVPGMAALVGAHRSAGHVTAVLTSATRYLAGPLAADIGIEHVIVTQLVVREGVFTGEAVRPVCYGKGKTYWAERFAAENGVDLSRSYFYTDSVTDLPVLERVGEPRVVNPDPRLRRVALRRGWPVIRPRLRDTPAGSQELIRSIATGGEETWRHGGAERRAGD
jgi:HAD superfamily hydrolase (TIGR01490 family)